MLIKNPFFFANMKNKKIWPEFWGFLGSGISNVIGEISRLSSQTEILRPL